MQFKLPQTVSFLDFSEIKKEKKQLDKNNNIERNNGETNIYYILNAHLYFEANSFCLTQSKCMNNMEVHSEGDQPWDFFGRKDAKAETPVFWSPHGKT